MRRVLPKLMLALMCGAALTLASAWGPMFFLSESSPVPDCSLAWPAGEGRVGAVLEHRYDWWLPAEQQQACIREGFIAPPETDDLTSSRSVYFTGWDSWVARVPAKGIASSPPAWPRPGPDTVTVRYAAGWPVRCVEGFEVFTGPVNEKGLRVRAREALIDNGRYGPLPCRPIALGVVVDVAVWSVLAGAGFLLGRAAVRRGVGAWRRRQGRCGGCGYPVVGLAGAVCPECGGVVRVEVGGRGQNNPQAMNVGPGGDI